MRFPTVLLLVTFLPSCVGWITAPPTANPVEEDSNASSIVSVECSGNLREFTAVTDMILTGRSNLLSLLERKVLKGEFMGIYNDLTTNNCDSFHRKVNTVAFLEQSNGEEVYTAQDMSAANVTLGENETQTLENWFTPADGDERRRLQQNEDFNSTQAVPDITVTYEITGTCRDCPITRAGSFQLYDDAFRRSLLGAKVQIRTRLLEVRELQDDSEDNKSDCVCAEGVPPTPQAPGVEECVDLMNERLPVVQDELGVLTELKLENLIQMDDLSELEETVDGEPEEDVSVSKTNPDDFTIWGRALGKGGEEEPLMMSSAARFRQSSATVAVGLLLWAAVAGS